MRELENWFKGLGDPTRLRILNLLLAGELCGCDIQYVLETLQPNVSRHLTYLKHAGLVLDRRDGYRVFYRLAEGKGKKKLLLEFLRLAFHNEESLRQDRERLRHAVRDGSCTLGEAPPFVPVGRLKPGASARG
ncbi:MAG TPA: metalloregulator ArsR/SmtB family transcription factor [Terriglobales bacterium]|jgi:ArsR family transcriptional regulator|nr:metalloregulator ArsR/SmtB family transcription factor [Terriglobales bacterium]